MNKTYKPDQLTDWFPGSVKPARPGVYQREYDDGEPVFCLFNGVEWLCYGRTPEEAATETMRSDYQDEPWCGLAEEPK